MSNIIEIYCGAVLGRVFLMLTVGILVVIALVGLDIVSELWYAMKVKRSKYKKIT